MRSRLFLLGACAVGAYYLYRAARDLAALDLGDLNDVQIGDDEEGPC
jgi:hypothetical protein